jgi:hypothetical protein
MRVFRQRTGRRKAKDEIQTIHDSQRRSTTTLTQRNFHTSRHEKASTDSLNETLIEESTFEDEENDDRESIATASQKTSQVAVPSQSTPSSSAIPTPTTAAALNAAVAAVTGGVPVRRLSQQLTTTAPPIFFPLIPHESVTVSWQPNLCLHSLQLSPAWIFAACNSCRDISQIHPSILHLKR